MVLEIVMVAASAVLLGGATWRQVKSIRTESVSANPAAWLILTAVSAVSLAALRETGADGPLMWIPVSQFLSTIAIFLVAIYNWKDIERLKRHDFIAACACIMGVAAGLWLHSPVVALLGNLFANLAGLWPMVVKGRTVPSDIDKIFWSGRGLHSFAAFAAFWWFSDDRSGTIPQTTGILMAGVMLTVSLLPARAVRTVNAPPAPARTRVRPQQPQLAGPYSGGLRIAWV